MKKSLAVAVLAAVVAGLTTGCTLKLQGEYTIMERWDKRPKAEEPAAPAAVPETKEVK